MGEFTQKVHSIPLDILDDLGSRFIINVPAEEREDMIRICFQLETAHWFYIDHYVGTDPKLRSCRMREFAEHMFRHIGFLKPYADRVEGILDDFRTYKMQIRTNGAIIMNEDCSQVLLVQGYWSRTSWGFPKGKVNQDESESDCAIREVLEETGYNIKDNLDTEDYLEAMINEQSVRLYMIPGVPTNTMFEPKTKNEIRDLRWFPIADLPNSKKDSMPKNALGIGANNLFMVLPFVRKIKQWVSQSPQQRKRYRDRQDPERNSGNFQKQNAQPKNTQKNGKNSRPKTGGGRTRKDSFAKESKGKRSSSGARIPEDFCPKVWQNFHLKKKDLLAALSAYP